MEVTKADVDRAKIASYIHSDEEAPLMAEPIFLKLQPRFRVFSSLSLLLLLFSYPDQTYILGV